MPESAHPVPMSPRPSAPAAKEPPKRAPPLRAGSLHTAGLPKLYDPGYANTISCISSITFLNGSAGILRYRGYPIESLATSVSFDQVAHLLIYKSLPCSSKLRAFRSVLADPVHSTPPSHVLALIKSFPPSAHPMSILVSAVAALSSSFPSLNPCVSGDNVYDDPAARQQVVLNVLALFPSLASAILHHISPSSIPAVKSAPQSLLSHPPSYTRRFLQAALPPQPPILERAIDTLLILHADHEQNCSTSAVRHLSSSGVDVFSALSSGIAALYGPLHGGACEAVVHMLSRIGDPQAVPAFLKGVKNKHERLMGFGHRVYKTYDPRAKIVRSLAHAVVAASNQSADPLIIVAQALERAALDDDYFVSRQLYPNVDFYSGIIYRAMQLPPQFFTVVFALGRVSGWLAHWLEFLDDPDRRIARPHQHYVGVMGPLQVPSLEGLQHDVPKDQPFSWENAAANAKL